MNTHEVAHAGVSFALLHQSVHAIKCKWKSYWWGVHNQSCQWHLSFAKVYKARTLGAPENLGWAVSFYLLVGKWKIAPDI